MAEIFLDLNDPEFLEDWFSLESQEALAVLRTLRKIRQMDWNQLYRDPGLKWEAIVTRSSQSGERLYTLRITQRMRAVACRRSQILRLLSLHPEHDSAYQ